MSTEHKIYWTEGNDVKSEDFVEIDLMLKFCEKLRQDRIAGKNIQFIAMSSENSDNVGKMGVASPDLSYDWTKRRGGRK